MCTCTRACSYGHASRQCCYYFRSCSPISHEPPNNIRCMLLLEFHCHLCVCVCVCVCAVCVGWGGFLVVPLRDISGGHSPPAAIEGLCCWVCSRAQQLPAYGRLSKPSGAHEWRHPPAIPAIHCRPALEQNRNTWTVVGD